MLSQNFFLIKLLIFIPLFCGAAVQADEIPLPSVGGHFNLAVPLATVGSSTKVFGRDYNKIGVAPGVTYKLNDKWGFDFEFVAYNSFRNDQPTSLVVDPGVIYNFGFLTGGMRLAVDVASKSNFGMIPIVVKTIPVGLVKLLFELDLPVFFYRNVTEVTIQPQLGVAF